MNLISKKVSLLLIIFPFLFIACSDDNEDRVVEVASVVVYDGETYDLDKGYIEYYGENEEFGSYDLEVYLMASAVSIDQSSPSDFSGEGIFLYIDFNTPEAELTSGTYTFAGKEDDRDPLTFFGGSAFKDYALLSDPEGSEDITGGTIKVTVEDEKTLLVIDLTTESSTIKGNFSNILEVVEL